MKSVLSAPRGERGSIESRGHGAFAPGQIVDALVRGLMVGLVLLAGMPQAPAATLLTWDITGSSGTTSGPAPSSLVIGVSGSLMTSGAGLATGNSTSPSNTWNRTYSTLFTSATASMAGGAYIEWTTTAAAGYTVSFDGLTGMSLSRTTSGPQAAELWYSTDGLNFIQTGSAVVITSTLTSAAPAFATTMTAAPIVLDGGAGGASLTWRLIGYSGISRMGIGKAATDDFSMLGTVTGGFAQNLTWVGASGDGTWDTDPANQSWTTGSAPAAFTTTDNVTFNTAGTVTVGAGVSAGTVAVSNPGGLLTIAGNGFAGTTLTKSGAGELLLTAANTLSGGVTANAGTVAYGASGAFGTQPLSLNGGTLKLADPAVTTMSNAYSSGTAGATITVLNEKSTISGVGTALGTQAGAGIARGDSRTFNTLVKTGTGTLALTGNLGGQMSYDPVTGNVTTAGGINLQVQEGAIEISGNRTWNLATGTAVTTGSTTFNGMQWDGNVNMRGGTIQINGGNIQGSGTIQVGLAGDAPSANTLQSRLNFAAPSIANTVSIADGFALTLTSNISSSIRLTGTILGGPAATITNSGNGTATISGTAPSTFTGNFVVTGSSAGGMSLSPQALATAAGVQINSTTTLSHLRINNAVPGAVVTTPITGGVNALVAINGSEKVTISGSNTYGGGTTLTGDVGITKLWDGADGSLGSGVIATGNADGRIFWDGPESTIMFNQAVATGTAATDRLGFAGAGKTFVLTGALSGTGLVRSSTSAVLDLTQQTATTNTNLGGVEIGNATVRAGSDENLGGGGLLFSGTSSVLVTTSATTSLARPITIGALDGAGIAATINTEARAAILSGTIADAPDTLGGGIVKVGSGVLILTASNGYTGPTMVQAGTLRLQGGADRLPSGNSVTVASGATLDLAGNDQTLGAVSGSGIIATGGGSLTVGAGDASSTFAGVITGSRGLIKSGSGTLSLSGTSTVTGTTSVQQGVLQLANASALGSSTLAVVAGGTAQVAPYLKTTVAGLSLSGTGLVDVTAGGMTVTSGLSATELVNQIIVGRAGGSWAGTSGITSSTAAADVALGTPRAVGWLDNGGGSLEFAYAAAGDTNLDWRVDVLDAANMLAAGKYNTNNAGTWAQGDFNYDGLVNVLDAAAFLTTGLYNQGSYNLPPSAVEAVAVVPEPSAWLVSVACLAVALGFRNRRSR